MQRHTAEPDKRQLQFLYRRERDKEVSRLPVSPGKIGRQDTPIVRNISASDAITLVSPLTQPLRLSWKNADESTSSEDVTVTV